MHGKGSIKYVNGEVFEGEFKMDKKEGMGKLIFVDKSYIIGNWVNNQIVGELTTFSKKGKLIKTEKISPDKNL
jgi:hypothetical protein